MGRLEIVNVRSPRGIAKILGTGISLAGVTTMTLYKGPALKNIGHALIHIRGSKTAIQESWLKGSLLTVASCITWSIWYIMQVFVEKSHLNRELSLSLSILLENLESKINRILYPAGIYFETISSTAFTNYMDEFCWSSTICCIHSHCAA